LRSLASSLLLHEKIITTEARAKELSPFVEKMITRAKKDNLASRRLLRRHFSPELTKRLMEEIAPRFQDRPGGYTRVLKMKSRRSDGANMAVIELV